MALLQSLLASYNPYIGHYHIPSEFNKDEKSRLDWFFRDASAEFNRDHYITNPNSTLSLLWVKFLKKTNTFALFDPPQKIGNLMTPVKRHVEKRGSPGMS